MTIDGDVGTELPARRAMLLRLLAAIGRPVLAGLRILSQAASFAFYVLLHACTPSTWRRTTRAEFRAALRLSVLHPMRTVLPIAALVGVLLVAQAWYWLGAYGQSDVTFRFLIIVLARQITPIFVGLLAFGRVGLIFLVELGESSSRGNWRMLQANGIDPLDYLVVPRVAALAIGTFTLSVIFIIVTLAVGYFTAGLLRPSPYSIWEFFSRVVETMDWRDFIVFPVKAIGVGVGVGLVCTMTGLRRGGAAAEPRNLLPRGFARSVIAIFAVSLLVDLVA